MRIAQVAPLYERVPPEMYGGTERVVSYLTEELVRLGHDVTLFASGDSVTAARLVAQCRRALRLDPECQDSLAAHVRMLGHVYQQARAFDIIHCHTGYLGLPLSPFVAAPTVITLHGRLDIPDIAPIFADYNDVGLISISDAQRVHLPQANWAATIHHGLPADLYPFQARSDAYLLFLGRISPEKRPDSAIRIARAAGMELRIAAKVDAVDREYFDSVIRPLLDHPLVRFVGEVDEAGKRELLGNARALLFPIDWPEPFGLVMIEALACGTPVIARRRGSIPEVITDGRTGFVCDTDAEMVEAARRVHTVSRTACREEFDRRFTVEAMVRRYISVYESAIAGAPGRRQGQRTSQVAARNVQLRQRRQVSL